MSRKAKQKLKDRGGFTTSAPVSRWTYPEVLASFRAYTDYIEKKETASREERAADIEAAFKDEGNNVVVLTITERREWLHERRVEAGQDPALNDYRVIDPELTLQWEILLDSQDLS